MTQNGYDYFQAFPKSITNIICSIKLENFHMA
jgi:hypothetical protein